MTNLFFAIFGGMADKAGSSFAPRRRGLSGAYHGLTPRAAIMGSLRDRKTAISLAAALLLVAFEFTAAADSSEAEIKGRQLAEMLMAQHPTENYTNTGVLHIRDGHGNRTDVPVRYEIHVTPANWSMTYDASIGFGERLVIGYADTRATEYHFHAQNGKEVTLSGNQTMFPLAGSDFWIADLGQEFLQWPRQKILKKETKRSRDCTVLESTNPNPAAGSYSRVVSWIDSENSGFVQAYAYDASGQLLKEFYPKDVKKVDGQWRVGMMEMENDQTGSRTRLEFNLGRH